MKTITIAAVVFGVALTGTGCKKKPAKPGATDTEVAKPGAGPATGSSAAGAASGSAAQGSAGGSAASAGSAAAGSAGSDTGAVEPAKTCSATAWKEKSGLFCIDPPPGFKAGKPEDYLDGDGVRIYFKREAADGKPEMSFAVTWRKQTDDANLESVSMAENMQTDYTNNKGEAEGKFAGGKGRYVVFARSPDWKSHQLYTVVNGNKHAYNCDASSYDEPIAPELIEGCKSVIPTD